MSGREKKNEAAYDRTLPKDHPLAEKAICCLAEKASECKTFYAEDMRITPCIGCNAWWLKTPGICAVKDDYEQILKAYLQYDVTVFISDTVLGFVDYKMKNVIDRILPMATMYTRIEDGQTHHVPRYEKEFRFGLLYAGNGNQAYLTHWMDRFCLNFHGISLGAFPIESYESS